MLEYRKNLNIFILFDNTVKNSWNSIFYDFCSWWC